MICHRLLDLCGTVTCALLLARAPLFADDYIRNLQQQAIEQGQSPLGHWGWEPDRYTRWGSHSSRLIPVYTFGTNGAGEGIDLTSYAGARSPYRSEAALKRLFGRVPEGTLAPDAEHFDQTNVFDIQAAALKAGKKHIILVVFDGMDWQTTRAASIFKTQSVAYDRGRGTGLHLQDYAAGGTSQFGFMSTAPWADKATIDVDEQTASIPSDARLGGYAVDRAGRYPWSTGSDLKYIVGQSDDSRFKHPYPDSANTATSMTAGIKSYNGAINVDHQGRQVTTIAHLAQQQGYRIGVVTSVPISHATPAAAYSHNVDRDDYQDLTRDLLGLKSVSHPQTPLPGVDVLMGGGFGISRTKDAGQGENFVPGNVYLTDRDLQAADVRSGGKYVVALRTAGARGSEVLRQQADAAIEGGHRLLAYFGATGGHLPYCTADGDYNPTIGRKKEAESYSAADILENPVLADFAEQALRVLSHGDKPFWLMVEAGDVDWANHDNNIDNSIGAVLSGDHAVKVITDWVEQHSSWDETVMIVTADHGHYLVLQRPELLIAPQSVP